MRAFLKRYGLKSVTLILLILLGAVAGYAYGTEKATHHFQDLFSRVTAIRDKSVSYEFTRPLLAYALPEATDIGKYSDLKAALNAEIAQAKEGTVTRASLYFRDL